MAQKSGSANKHNPPIEWLISGAKPDHYETGIAKTVAHSGTRCAYMRHAVDRPEAFGTLMQEFSPHNYLGKRLRMASWIKTEGGEGWVGAWMSVYGKAGRINISFDNMCQRPITGTTEWTKYEIVLDVPNESTKIGFGVILSGKGKLWFDDITLDVVSEDTAVTDCQCSERHKPLAPRNLNFESEDAIV
jgi:hypothetical protein